ncbi:MAG: DUF885 domain-containing protein [Bacteroidota bacterium]|jgi:uncharacterized protein (DUF885 family)|nr:DUF885 domain-containing protein [Cytophagales bacterium]MCE2956605.1 DUF885 domain-containing protein [Flammeovirgaceae bacterium]MCZ8071484.1 DUF885 domain-containing protein [Cytophagales bacterium]
MKTGLKKNLIILTLLLAGSCKPSDDRQQDFHQLLAELTPSRMRGLGLVENDMSKASFDSLANITQRQLAELNSFDSTQLTGDDLIDWKFAHSILAGKEIEQQQIQNWRKDPRQYMTFTSLSSVMEGPQPLDEKIKVIEKNLTLAHKQMQNGMLQLDTFVARFQELGLFMAENGLVLFEKELPAFIQQHGDAASNLVAPAAEAKKTLQAFITFLKTDLPQKPKGNFAIGKEKYNKLLKYQYLLRYDADSLYAFGLAQFDATVKELEALALKMNPNKTWQQLARDIKGEYPEPHRMIEVHQEWVDKCRDHIIKNNLIPIPWKERVKVVARAPYLRKTSYYGHFSFAKAKDADSIYTSEMHINPFEEEWDEKRKKEYLLEHDWGVIMVTAPHETYAGHHIQGLYQVNNPRPLRRENSISIFSEGWGLYNEQLFRETGFFPNDKILLRQLQLRLWRNARVIYDVGLHTEKMTYQDAVKLMREGVGFLEWASQLEIDASCASPGYFIGYFTGMMEILQMREEYKKLKGDQFSLSEFHERLLKIGAMPIPLMREALFNGNE